MKNKEKIVVHIIPSLRRGGAERFVVDLCNELASGNQFKIHLVSLEDNDFSTTFLSEISGLVEYKSFNKKPGLDLGTVYKLSNWLRKLNPDVIHTHTSAFEYLALYRVLNSKKLYWHTIHNSAKEECPNTFLKHYRRHYYKNNVTPIAISKDGSDTYREYYKLNNCVLITNGRPTLKPSSNTIKLKEKYISPLTYLLVNIGRITPQKNQKLLIESIQYYNKISIKKCKLLIIGGIRDSQLNQELEFLCRADPNIYFLGEQENTIDYLAVADALCITSTFEGMPISLIEAFSVGCIPISTRAGGVSEMIQDSYNGFLSEDMSLLSYVKAIDLCLKYTDKAKIRKNGVDSYFQKYHISIAAKSYAEQYLNY
jgi:glycosyltransferase involved in cell wall biosynthesis